ncbi:galactose ABC transporter substrate-binding protein [Clostridium sp. SHJSY1]|uniref:galactose ABC transporter substrate-binding protein n=1 Tax=Clostridium sp. SHJSY1 TaxID=2942483 RepID=UPI002873F561|nr:galactose ABC transporter substrate-binding protein [Clostridium sp. SHJSY1]MDS0527686.1 galactose ABC transporter substrate-binding protein [Clostridium sp. SHJSY1]
MKIIKKIIVFITMISMLTFSNVKVINIKASSFFKSPVKVGVLLNNFYNPYNLEIKKSLEDIEAENKNEVQFSFFDGKGNLAIESEIINNMIQSNYDLLLLAIVDKKAPELVQESIYKAKQKNIPLIFINTNPANLDLFKEYSKTLAINTDSIQASILQGKMIVDEWNKKEKLIDKNGDNILQYVMLGGESESFAAIVRSKYSISTINASEIKTQELAKVSANWNSETAESAISPLFLKYGGRIEAIISNNDSMAIGAIKALQKYGYNMGNKAKTIPIFGIGGVPEAQELIKKDFMTGTVLQNTRLLANALYIIGMNLVSGKEPLEGVDYKFDKTGKIIFIPFEAYVKATT